ncbi:MAG TPA: HAD-IIIA family hydrolase [Candidatus Binatia bacterium]|nr:HAD-IIIA family hydrolase [Candidatus Binatia bacterium]
MTPAAFDVVVPTVGRPSLPRLLGALAGAAGPLPGRVVLVDDRRDAGTPLLAAEPPPRVAPRLRVVASGGRGPAAARNRGWRETDAPWVAFLDDDVVPTRDWLARLAADLAPLGPDAGASQGRVRVPPPLGRRRTDWERHVQGLERARWATADMAYRREALARVGGFDERFARAYREDADLGLRVAAAGFRLVAGTRRVRHPARPAGAWASVRLQRGNADDALMRARHGRDWRVRAGAPAGRLPRHLATTAAGIVAVAGAVAGTTAVAAAGGAAWLAGTAELAWARIAPGPRTPREVATMLATSVLLPPVASFHHGAGVVRWGAARRHARPAPPAAVLLDRDGTLVVDVPGSRDPARVALVPGAPAAVERLRRAGVALAVVSNQAGVAAGAVTPAELAAIHRRIEDLLGPLGPWMVCPHAPEDACACRKPAPGLLLAAAAALGVPPERCAVIGDTGADVAAARAAGARAILVPNAVTRREEIARAPETAPDLPTAVDRLLGAGPA